MTYLYAFRNITCWAVTVAATPCTESNGTAVMNPTHGNPRADSLRLPVSSQSSCNRLQ